VDAGREHAAARAASGGCTRGRGVRTQETARFAYWPTSPLPRCVPRVAQGTFHRAFSADRV